jgi:hypothetical protein
MNVGLGFGTPPYIYQIDMSAKQKYHPEQLLETMSKKKNKPLWILLDKTRFSLDTDEQLKLACELASFYHNQICCDDNDVFIDNRESIEINSGTG